MVSAHVCVLLCEYVFLFVLGRKIKNCIVLECFSILNSTVLVLMKNSLKRIKEKIFKRKNCFISMHTARVAMGTQIQEWERTFFQSVLGRSISTGSGRKPDVISGKFSSAKGLHMTGWLRRQWGLPKQVRNSIYNYDPDIKIASFLAQLLLLTKPIPWQLYREKHVRGSITPL